MSFDETFNDTINAYFVSTKTSNNNEFETALGLLRNYVPEENIRNIKASEGYPLISTGRLTKKDVFIFDHFEGDFFNQLQQTKSLIIGPRCLITCLLKCEAIPMGTSPVYTTAMRDLKISATGMSVQEKEKLKTLVQYMGGHYFQNFGLSVTHLVSNTIKSNKYEHATLNGIAVMHVDWVQRVWERSCSENVMATDEEFEKYKLPIFFGTNITCTGLDNEKKDKVMQFVNENGGTYHRAFRSQFVDIVITEKDKTDSEKCKAAIKYKKDILLPEWIFDSVEKGFALPTKNYQVKAKRLKVSTPTKTDQSIANFTVSDQTGLTDISRISMASGRRNNMSNVNDTICSSLNDTQLPTFAAPAPPAASSKDMQKNLLKKSSAEALYRLVYDEICPKQAKKAGSFLDGCCIYLSGFKNEEKEKLNRILNVGGATRYDVVNDQITHIIVGQLDDAELKNWKRDGLLGKLHILRLDWLLQSIKLKQPANEAAYRVSLPLAREPDAPSPSSKRTLRSMNHSFKQPDVPIKKKLFEANSDDLNTETLGNLMPVASSTEMPMDQDEEHNLISQYSQENVAKAEMPPPPSKNEHAANESIMAPPIATSTQWIQNRDVTNTTQTNQDNDQQAAAANPSITESCMTIDYENLNMFDGLTLYIEKSQFAEELYVQILNECEAAKGNMVPATFRDPVDYAIVSFERSFDISMLPVKAKHVVTDLYVESCLKENKIIPIQYYHQHIPHTGDTLPLKGMTIVISIYSGLERDFIDSMGQLLGAKFNNSFIKKEKPLLVCPLPEGSKYQGALKWRYPVVKSQWLVDCAKEGIKLPYKSYLVGNCVEDFPISPSTLREKKDNNIPTTATTQDASTANISMDVDMENNAAHNHEGTLQEAPAPAAPNLREETDYTPLRNKRVSELAGPLRNAGRNSLGDAGGDSPHTPLNNYPRRSTSNYSMFDEMLAEIENEADRATLREVIEELKNNQTPELQRLCRQVCTPQKVPTPKGIPEFCTTPAFEKRMADEFERRWRLPLKKIKPDTPINILRKRVLKATCEALGVAYDSDFEEEYAAENANNELQKSQKRPMSISSATARSSLGGRITTPVNHQKSGLASNLNPRSILAQLTPGAANSPQINITTRNARDSDAYIPGTQTPNSSGRLLQNNQSTSNTQISSLGQRASLGKSTINFDKLSFEDTTLDAANNGKSSMSRNSNATSSNTSSPEIKQITEYLRNCENRRQSMKRSRANGDESRETDSQMPYIQQFESEQFGANTEEMVGWRDPVEFNQERRSKNASAPSMQYKGKPKFSISFLDANVLKDIIAKIQQLGGEVSENLLTYDATCTHMLCERPNRGEKILGCISSGKWVLSIKYIDECFAKDKFIDEELYEWGNCKALNLPQISHDEMTIASAAHRWRVELKTQTIPGAFAGFRVILRVAERSMDSLKNVIKAGKGQVIEATAPYSEESGAHLATHVFVDVKKTPLSQIDYEFFKHHGIKMYSQIYINTYLMNGRDADFSKYEIKL